MKITKEQLRQVIKEELEAAIRETPEEKAQKDYDRMIELLPTAQNPRTLTHAESIELGELQDKFEIIRNVASPNDRRYGRSQRGYLHTNGVMIKGSIDGRGSLGS